MELKISPYTLEFRSEYAGTRLSQSGAGRSGVLISDGLGVADLHSWPELGDPSLSDELEAIKKGRPLDLGALALDYLRIDAALRSKRSVAMHASQSIAAHCLLPLGEAHSDFDAHGARFFKLKMSGSDLRQSERRLKGWLDCLGPSAQLRLDYNFSLTQEAFLDHLKRLQGTFDQIQFFEDPFLFVENQWWLLSEHEQIALAFDRGSLAQKTFISPRVDMGTASHLYVVTKPLSEPSAALAAFATQSMRRLVVTSSLGHPIGQAQAAHTFCEIQDTHPLVLETTGLASHICYEPNAFSESLVFLKGELSFQPSGFGWGFDEALKNLKWVDP